MLNQLEVPLDPQDFHAKQVWEVGNLKLIKKRCKLFLKNFHMVLFIHSLALFAQVLYTYIKEIRE